MAEEDARMKQEMAGQVSETALVVLDTRFQDAKTRMHEKNRLVNRTVRSSNIDHRGYAAGHRQGAQVYARASRPKVGGGRKGIRA